MSGAARPDLLNIPGYLADLTERQPRSLPVAVLAGRLRSTMHSAVMEHASLVDFLTGKISPEALAKEINAEVIACNAAFHAGEQGYIVITDGPSFEVTRDGARRLLRAVADNRFSFELANYVADCIIMSHDFDFADDAVRDAMHFIEDDSRPPTRDETLNALAAL